MLKVVSGISCSSGGDGCVCELAASMLMFCQCVGDVCRTKLRSYRTKAYGTCAASNCIRAFRYACGQSRASQLSDRSEKNHLGECM